MRAFLASFWASGPLGLVALAEIADPEASGISDDGGSGVGVVLSDLDASEISVDDASGISVDDASGISVDDASGAGVEVSGAGVEVSGAGVEVSGAGVEVSGAGVEVSDASVDSEATGLDPEESVTARFFAFLPSSSWREDFLFFPDEPRRPGILNRVRFQIKIFETKN